jgi:hypothetical protein
MIYIISILLFGLYIISNLRYDLRYYILYLLTLKNNVGFIWVTNITDAKRYLQSSNKGNCIEMQISRHAWKPILSLESENGETWTILKERLLFLMKQLPDMSNLTAITDVVINIDDTVITSKEIGILTIRIFLQYIFGVFDVNRLAYHNQNCSELYDASLEFRKEIALKGRGNYNKKLRAVEIIREYIATSSYNLPDDIYSISVILQPFIISPSINVSDIAIHWDLNDSIDINIARNHPFPILEREINIDGKTYQAFIPTDELHILPFGYGERQCTGKMIANTFLKTFFVSLMTRNIYVPKQNHLYSGRDNDKVDDFEAILFQICTIFRMFIPDCITPLDNDTIYTFGH